LQQKSLNFTKFFKYSIFIKLLNKDAITYIDNFDIEIVIKEEFAKRIRR